MANAKSWYELTLEEEEDDHILDETNQHVLLNDPIMNSRKTMDAEGNIPQNEEKVNRDPQKHLDPIEEDEGFDFDEANLQIDEVFRKTIGSGCNTSVWYESWIPTILARPTKLVIRFQDHDPTRLVHALIHQDSCRWNKTVLRELIQPGDVPFILGMRPSRLFTMDGYTWSYTKSGNYTVRS